MGWMLLHGPWRPRLRWPSTPPPSCCRRAGPHRLRRTGRRSCSSARRRRPSGRTRPRGLRSARTERRTDGPHARREAGRRRPLPRRSRPRTTAPQRGQRMIGARWLCRSRSSPRQGFREWRGRRRRFGSLQWMPGRPRAPLAHLARRHPPPLEERRRLAHGLVPSRRSRPPTLHPCATWASRGRWSSRWRSMRPDARAELASQGECTLPSIG